MPSDRENPPEQMILLDGQEMSDLLHGRDVLTESVLIDDDGEVVYSETKVVNGSGKRPGFDEGTESVSSLGWKGQAIAISVMMGCVVVAAYFTSRIPFEEVFATEAETPGFYGLVFPIAFLVLIVWTFLHLPSFIRGARR